MLRPVIDLHCDLLGCVECHEEAWNFETPDTNCCLPQMEKGGVKIQMLAIATLTYKGSTRKSERQVELYRKLLQRHKSRVGAFKEYQQVSKKVHFLFAIENSSGLAEENEPLERAFERFEAFSKVEKILYVSLTWNGENRFGGGCGSNVGLKEDGERLLRYLSGKDVLIDLSHASDSLAFDVIDFIHKEGLAITPIASHSNFRKVLDVPRNLPDAIAKEIIRLRGVIGINFVRHFIGDRKEDFLRHIQYGLSLKGENALCLGADFFGGFTVPPQFHSDLPDPMFQKEFSNSSCYPEFFSFLEEWLTKDQMEKIAYKNAYRLIGENT
jgi:membrane dipeptidase